MVGAVGDLRAVAMTLYGEARGCHLLDCLAVMAVIRERYLRPGWWSREPGDGIPDDTWEAVVRDPWQFTSWHTHDAAHRRNHEAMLNAEKDDPAGWARMFHLAHYGIYHMTDDDVRQLFFAESPDDFPTHFISRPLTAPPLSWGDDVRAVPVRYADSAFRFYIVPKGRPQRRR